MSARDHLIRLGRLDAARLDAFCRERGLGPDDTRLPRLLLEAKLLPEPDYLRVAADLWGLDQLTGPVEPLLDPALVKKLPVDWARQHLLLPVRLDGRIRSLLRDPSDLAPQEDLAALLGEDPLPLLASEADIRRAIDLCYLQRREGGDGESSPAASSAPAAAETGPASPAAGSEDLLRVSEGAPVSQLVNRLLLEAVRQKASDIHLEPFEDVIRVRYRVDGMLYDQPSPPRDLEAALASRLKVMARLDIVERRLPQDGMMRVRVGSREIDVRMSTVPVGAGERIVLRLLNRESALHPLGDLGMSGAVLEGFRALLKSPQGILLVTGPTGSGKTTTLYAALQELDTRRRNILTIEDPIEYQLPSIGQIQVNPKIDLSFARCLRHVLRQDPDVILVGETRDLDTAEISVRASLTGHLVLTTLHTNDAFTASVRLADMGIPPYLLASALRGVLAQRLLRTLCPACRRESAITADDVREYGPVLQPHAGKSHWTAAGCPACLEGYAGRTGVYELLTVTRPLAEAIRAGASLERLREVAAGEGVRTMAEDAVGKVLAGATSLAETARVLGRLE